MKTPAPRFEPIPIDDVACGLECSARSFGQLAALFAAIAGKAPEGSDSALLAELGRTVALDMQEFAGCTLEQLQKGGVRQ